MKCSFDPYEGSEKYIFVSYSHANSDRVAPILEKLNFEGFRIWYDDGIEWGTEWPEAIASHLQRCEVCMIFHSSESIVSLNCRQEINYAIKLRKSILSVYLEDVRLSEGMDMQLSPFQSTYPYQYENQNIFFERLINTSILQSCRGVFHECVSVGVGGSNVNLSHQHRSQKKSKVSRYWIQVAISIIGVFCGIIFGGRYLLQNHIKGVDSTVDELEKGSVLFSSSQDEIGSEMSSVLPDSHNILGKSELSVMEQQVSEVVGEEKQNLMHSVTAVPCSWSGDKGESFKAKTKETRMRSWNNDSYGGLIELAPNTKYILTVASSEIMDYQMGYILFNSRDGEDYVESSTINNLGWVKINGDDKSSDFVIQTKESICYLGINFANSNRDKLSEKEKAALKEVIENLQLVAEESQE